MKSSLLTSSLTLLLLVCTATTSLAASGPATITTQPAAQTILQGNPVTFSVVADGTPPLGYQWLTNGSAISGANGSSDTIPATAPSHDGLVFSVIVTNDLGSATSSNATLRIDPGVEGNSYTTNLVNLSSQNWRYFTNGIDLGTAWRAVGFDDSAWRQGQALLGLETTPAVYTEPFRTTFPAYNNQIITHYFRTHFTFSPTGNVHGVTVTVNAFIDDGALFYINGVQIGGVRLAAGASATTVASNQDAEGAVDTFSFSPTNLVVGDNVLAVEVHQGAAGSSDLAFGMGMTGTIRNRIPDTAPPVVVNTLPPASAVVSSLIQVEVFFNEPVDGVEASDLLVNGIPATGITYGDPTQFAFDFPQPPTGTVTFAFAPAHGIRDRAVTPNPFAGYTWNLTLNPNAAPAGVSINEFMAANQDTLNDEDGDASDWIELYNPGPLSVNLFGWSLTDQTNFLTKWRFPNVTMNANSYLLVFASGKNRTNNTARLHANFQLSASGEYLALVDAATNVVSQFFPTYPPQQDDVSYGRDRLNPAFIGYFSVPTPRAPNSTSGAGFAPEVQFSRDSGTFNESAPFQLTLSTPGISNAVIYYALGTNLPGTNSTRYTAPISISGSTLIQARAFVPGVFPGPIATKSYIALANATNVLNFASTLPIMILHNFGQGAVPASKTEQYVVMQTFEPNSGRSIMTNAPDHAESGAFHVRGSSTAVGSTGGKSSFYMKILDALKDKMTIELLGLPNESDWVLYAPNQFEPALIHNPLAFDFARQQGEYASRYRFFEMFLKDDSGAAGPITFADYYGVFVLEEKIKRDPNRVDIAKLEPEHVNQPEVTGGYMMSIDRVAVGEQQFSAGGAALNWIEPDYVDMTNSARAPQVAYLTGYLNAFNAALNNSALWTNPVTGYAAYIDVDSWVTRHIHEVITFNVDALRLSGYLYKDRGEKVKYGPAWDYDRTQGSTDGRDANPRTWRSQVPDLGTDFFNFSPWWGRLFNAPDFWQRWIDRYQELRQVVYAPTNVVRTIDEVTAKVREAHPREFIRWGRTPRTANGTGAGTYDTEIQWKKNWYSNRLDFIDSQFEPPPRLSAPGGQSPSGFTITLSGPPGASIYYTMNGSDPRASGGAIAVGAQLYTVPIVITNNARVVARSRDLTHFNTTGANNPPISSPWSGPTAGTFVIQTPPLVITELMYNPAPPTSATDTNDADNFEFVELRNISTNALSLVGFRFTNGIEFTFSATNGVTALAPGEHVLLVKNRAAFTARYGARTNIAGEYGGSFDNAGERVTLVGPFLEPVLDFIYSDSWLPLTDGFGFSLVIKNENASLDTWGDQESWRVSSSEHGSPGVANPPAPNLGVVWINEALTHTDAPVVDTVELFNPGTNDVNIGGWFLTDDAQEPKKYQIPANTIIPAGGFILFDESQFNPGGNGFAFGSDGDDLYVFSASGGLLTGHAHGFSFGAAQNGVTFGRYVTSQGFEHFVAQASNTLGASNSLPRVGPVVISEIMYHPPDVISGTNIVDNSLDEFIELYNITQAAVPLYNTVNVSNTWRLTQAVSFDFPTNVSIAPTSMVLVVNFNPATNASQLAAFRAKYGVSPSVPVFGPYGGKLGNDDESVRLRRPDNVNTNGFVPYIIVDQVDYQDAAGWSSAADGVGASLQRLILTDYGNDPTNWVGAVATAGKFFQGGTAPSIVQQPSNASAFITTTTNFSVVVSGSGARVQWRFNGSPIPGATNSTLTLVNISYLDAGLYDVVAYNAGGAALSSNALLEVLTPINFGLQPVSQNVLPGTNVTLVAVAFGTPPITYQWRYEGVDIPGATNSIYSFVNASLANHGNYQVTARDAYGSIDSTNAFIFVRIVPVILVNPVSQFVVQGGNAYYSCLATGAPPIRYRWIRSGQPFTTNTTGLLVISNVQVSLVNGIRVNVVNDAPGSVNSTAASLIVLPDFDGDGIGDSWEARYGFNTNSIADGALDADGDGMSNHDEFVAGTNPTNVLSVLKLQQTGPDSSVLQFVAETNTLYTVQSRTNLTSAPWDRLTNILGATQVRTIQIPVTNSWPELERYYRVVTPILP